MLCAIFFGHAKLIDWLDELTAECVAATFLDETIKPITAVAPAFGTGHAQHIELADEVAEDDCAVARHSDHDRIENLASILSKKEVARRRPVFQRRKDTRVEVWSRGGQGSISFGIKRGRWRMYPRGPDYFMRAVRAVVLRAYLIVCAAVHPLVLGL